MGARTHFGPHPDFARRFRLAVAECPRAPQKVTPLARFLNVTQPTCFAWWWGDGMPGSETLREIAEKLGTSLDFLTRKGPPRPHEIREHAPSNGSLAAELEEIVSIAETLPPADREAWLALGRSLSKRSH